MKESEIMEKLTKKNSILYNQLWINKAIEEGHMDFIPVHKFSNKSIGECIEIKYNQLYKEEYDRHFRNGTLDEYNHQIEDSQKITKKNSILYTREWINKALEDGEPIPTRKVCNNYSVGEIIALQYYKKEILTPDPEIYLKLSGEGYSRKKLRK